MHNPVDTYFVNLLMGSNSAFLDHFALTVTNAMIWVPMYVALLLLVIKNHGNMQQIFICFGCAVLGVLLATGLTSIITKPIFERLRPCNDPEFKFLAAIAGNLHNNDYSFFSSHAATSMSLVTFFAWLVRSKLLTLSMLLWSLTVAWTRLYLGQHFMSDVAVGALWGIMTGMFAYFLYNRFCKRVHRHSYNVSNRYTSTGYLRKDVDAVVLIIIATFFYALIPL